jgi:hypothetical protein
LALKLIPGAVCRALGFKLQDLTFSCNLTKNSKSPRKNSNRAAQECPKLADTYAAPGNSIFHPAA